jgi:putative ABC transport system permease protein
MVFNAKLRSWLTIVGIVIGVASVVAIVGVGNGMEKSINDQLGDLGPDMITVYPGATKASSFGHRSSKVTEVGNIDPITNKEIQTIRGITGIEHIMGSISGGADLYYMGSEGSLSITGVNQQVWTYYNSNDLDEGRFLGPSDSNVIVIGYSLAHNYFDDEIGINKILTIEDKAFRVVGILEDGTGNNILMPINSAYDVLDDKEKGEYDKIEIIPKDGVDIEELTDVIDIKIMNTRHVNKDDKDFSVFNTLQATNMKNEMVKTLTTFLTAIAAISLLVGAVGIANTMFTSVLEKTKQIGIMKAIGARNKDILIIFLFSASIIALCGGLAGVVFGWLLAMLLSAAGMTTVITMSSVFQALLVAVLAGIIAGFIPAKQASKLNPVDALRYE